MYGGQPFWQGIFIYHLLFFSFCWSEAHLTANKLCNWFLASKLQVKIVRLATNVTDMHCLCFQRLLIAMWLLLWNQEKPLKTWHWAFRMLCVFVPAFYLVPRFYYTQSFFWAKLNTLMRLFTQADNIHFYNNIKQKSYFPNCVHVFGELVEASVKG